MKEGGCEPIEASKVDRRRRNSRHIALHTFHALSLREEGRDGPNHKCHHFRGEQYHNCQYRIDFVPDCL